MILGISKLFLAIKPNSIDDPICHDEMVKYCRFRIICFRHHFQENNMNVIHMMENFTFRNHICMTFELLSINLYELIKKNKFHGFSLQVSRKAHSKYFPPDRSCVFCCYETALLLWRYSMKPHSESE